MIEHIKGDLLKITPAYVVVETAGVGYLANISLSTFSKLEGKSSCMLFIHEVIREDSYQLFGFADEDERHVFRLLISVTGVGAATARLMLSSLSPDEIRGAISTSDINLLKSVKGVGLKTAQRIVVDLKDKVDKQGLANELFVLADNTTKEGALSALVMLGFAKATVEKVLDNIIRKEKGLSVEDLIKRALKNM